jgi:hypothetical protein
MPFLIAKVVTPGLTIPVFQLNAIPATRQTIMKPPFQITSLSGYPLIVTNVIPQVPVGNLLHSEHMTLNSSQFTRGATAANGMIVRHVTAIRPTIPSFPVLIVMSTTNQKWMMNTGRREIISITVLHAWIVTRQGGEKTKGSGCSGFSIGP